MAGSDLSGVIMNMNSTLQSMNASNIDQFAKVHQRFDANKKSIEEIRTNLFEKLQKQHKEAFDHMQKPTKI